jgi:hypothetical protein
VTFELARPEHTKAVDSMRRLSALALTEQLGPGHWSGSTKLASIRERIKFADPCTLLVETVKLLGRLR